MLIRKGPTTTAAAGWAVNLASPGTHRVHTAQTSAINSLTPSACVWLHKETCTPRSSIPGAIRAIHRSTLPLQTITVSTRTCAASLLLASSLSVQRRHSASDTALADSPAAKPEAVTARLKQTKENEEEELGETERATSVAQDVPAAVQQRINSGKRDLLRLLQCATTEATTKAPAMRLEAAFCRQLGLHDLAQQLIAPDRRARPAMPETWVAAIWDVLAPHCYFTKMDKATTVARNHHNSTAKEENNTSTVATKDDVLLSAVYTCVFDWAAAMDQLASLLPYEGWSEQQVYAHLCLHHKIMETHPPLWLPRYTHADSLAKFVHDRYQRQVLVTRSAVTGEPIFHRAGHNSVAVTWTSKKDLNASSSASSAQRPSLACESIQHALHIIGRGHQLPVWTDAVELVPLLSVKSGLASASPAAWKAAWLRDADLRGAFHLDGYVRLRAKLASSQLLIIVDTITLATTKTNPSSLLNVFGVELRRRGLAAAGRATSVKFLTRSTSAEAATQPFRDFLKEVLGAVVVMTEDVVVDALLEPQHVVAALLDAEAAAAKGNKQNLNTHSARISGGESGKSEVRNESDAATQVLVFCGDAARTAFEETLKDVTPMGVEVTLLTPTTNLKS